MTLKDMIRAALADDVVRYINNHIDSVPELEAIILLRASAPKAWTSAEMAARIYIDVQQAGLLLLGLERKKMAAVASSGGFVYALGNVNSALFEQVADAYRTNLVAVSELIHSKTSPALREFARAFRFKE